MPRNQSSSIRETGQWIGRFIAPGALLAAAITVSFAARAFSQTTANVPPLASAVPSSAPLPEPIFWKQSLFQIPYQWGSPAEPGAAQIVWLLVSKDRGVTWQKISEAKPHVTSFNYRAEREGEYWFAVRTIDHQGRAWPAGDYQPELRVIVDTTMPTIDDLQAHLQPDGSIEIQWRGSDSSLDPSSWKIEAQSEPFSNWQSVPLAAAWSMEQGAGSRELGEGVYSMFAAPSSQSTGQTVWQPPPGRAPVAIRASVSDRAGNSATFRTVIKSAASGAIAYQRLPSVASPSAAPAVAPMENSFTNTQPVAPPAQPDAPPNTATQGWVSGSVGSALDSPVESPRDQFWPASAVARAPFRLSSNEPIAPDDGVTAYGNPSGVDSPFAMNVDEPAHRMDAGPTARYAMNGQPHEGTDANDSSALSAGPAFQPLQPFRQASVARLPAPDADMGTSAGASPATVGPIVEETGPPLDAYASQPMPASPPKHVGSRTFALEYDVQDVGRWGVSKVELWGTRDGGLTWRRYGQDVDQRSPLVVTVDEEGVYGFRIVVEGAGGAAAVPPSTGDAPELWVAVDLRRPIAELTAIEPGGGNLADHLILRWSADDDNLEPRPISLFYSSRPGGPWSVVAGSLENTGEYAWRVERHVPARFYLRLEARDTAGNLAAFQTRDPIEFAAPGPNVRLRSAEPVDPTATGGATSYR